MRNTILFTAVLFIAVIVASVFYFRALDKGHNLAARPLKHLPDNALLIVSLQNNEISDNIFKDFDIFEALLGKNEIEQLARFRNQILRHEEVHPFVEDTEVYISFHPSQGGTETILTVPTVEPIATSQFPGLLRSIGSRYKVSSTDTLGHKMYHLAYGDRDSVLHVLYHQNILFASQSRPLLSKIVDKGTRHLPNEQIDFFVKNSSRNTPLSVYFPHQQYDSIVHLYQRRTGGPFLDLFKDMQGQSAWNINFKQDALMLTGESELDQYSENYVSLFKNQEKGTQRLYRFFPANTAVYTEYSISDRARFQKDLKDLFKRRKESLDQETVLSDVAGQVEHALGNEFASMETNGQNYLAFVRLRDTTAWKGIQSAHLEHMGDSVFRFKNPQVFYRILGDPFKPLARPYVIVVEDVAVLANSSSTLKAYRDDWLNRNLLTGTLGFTNFEKLQGNEANVTLFVHTKNAQQKIVNSLNKPFQDNFRDKDNFGFQDFYSWSVQLSGNDGKLSSQIYAVYKSKSALGVTPEWTYSLDNNAITRPYVFEHSDTSKFILIQELDHTVHAIHPTGRRMWSAVFSGRVVGDMQQLEDRSIVLVTDKNRLYRFDTEGKPLSGFSVPLPDEPVATPTIATIHGNKIILVPTRRAIQAFDMEGREYEQWRSAAVQDDITGPVRSDKERFVVSTRAGWVYFLDQQGEELRIDKTAEANGFQNPVGMFDGQVLSTDSTGVFYRFTFDKPTVRFKLDRSLSRHFSDFVNVNATTAPELVLLDKGHLRVYDIADSARLLYEYNFTKDIVNRPQYFSLESGKGQHLLGIASRSTNLIYLFEGDGSVMGGFPVEGQPLFYYGRINYNSDTYLLTMRRDRKLYAFKHQK